MSLFLSFHFFVCSGCTGDHNFVTQTVGVGQNVTLTCTRQKYLYEQPTLHWIRLVSGKSPELLGGTHAFDYDGIYETPHITAKQGPGTFILQIHETQLNDSGFYYWPEPDIIDIIQVPPSDPEHPGDSVSLQCSVLSDSEKKTCPEQQHRVFWFRTGSDESHPRLIYADGNNQDECETKPEAQSLQKCIYNFSKTVTSSDAGTYYCAVATCGQILFGNGTKLDNKGNYRTFFLHVEFSNYHLSAHISYFKIQLRIFPQRNEDSLVYSAPAFNKRKVERRNAKTSQEETIYTDVNTSARN
uniref:Ig-like domain-containing protein n=1 Tax=Amphiprion ocellaris TaxID=80972 RepID=A0A3Q1CV48_AMPOC